MSIPVKAKEEPLADLLSAGKPGANSMDRFLEKEGQKGGSRSWKAKEKACPQLIVVPHRKLVLI